MPKVKKVKGGFKYATKGGKTVGPLRKTRKGAKKAKRK